MNLLKESFFWYDLETFGVNPQTDRIAQFAGIRTDLNLNIIEEPVLLYCKLSPDFLPDPLSCLVTHITPQEANKKGVCENEFISQINEHFSKPFTCVVGFNNIKFDDEFIRNALYRNLLDPYSREYSNGNSRWDLINVIRMTHDLRPEGIVWPQDEQGRPRFALTELTKANQIEHTHAHDALADVYATIAVAKLLKEKQPRMFDYLYSLRQKERIKPFLDFSKKEPFLYSSTAFLKEGRNTSVVLPVAINPKFRNKGYVFDLTQDPTPLIELSSHEIQRRLFSPDPVLQEEGVEKIRILSIAYNRSPAIAPLKVLKESDAKRLGIDLALCKKHQKMLAEYPELNLKLIEIFCDVEENPFDSELFDPDFMLYSGGFIGDGDRQRLQGIRELPPQEMLLNPYQFDDPRLQEMVWRFVCRNYPQVLDQEQLKRWKSFCASRLLVPPGRISDFNFYMRKIQEHLANKEISAEDKVLLRDLLLYGRRLGAKVLNYRSEDMAKFDPPA